MEKQVVKELKALNESIMEVKQMNELFGGDEGSYDGSIDTVTCTPHGNKLDNGDPDA